ncbi:MAG: hypothetical protein J6X08_02560 [Lachnospiraceae bacterium]|nr:hypothetical protein [Lachnospiraceae bacterium]
MSGSDKFRPKMSREDRAKQFMPFAALKGYEEALRAKEKEIEEAALDRHAPLDEESNVEPSDIP